ncbi:MAG: bifunctional methylenetetrahydrofolate dehydrogenase/methenyltetrahydrofolate cyclohydrolase FolD [Lachnospirales bacterium]
MLLNGKEVSKEIKEEIKKEVELLEKKPTLVVVLVGDNKSSAVYVKNKEKACDYVGFNSKTYRLGEETTEDELLSLINNLNKDKEVDGVLIQLPLPNHINEKKVIYSIDPKKDVDCFNPYNVGLVSIGEGDLLPCTPAGVIQLLKRNKINMSGKNVAVVGRSNIVGKPMAQLLLKENATVTITHSKTENIEKILSSMDIIVVACGMPKFLKEDMVKDGAIVVDVGIHREDSGKLVGDADFENISDKCSYISPVPGGVGPMTIAMLLQNCLNLYKLKK